VEAVKNTQENFLNRIKYNLKKYMHTVKFTEYLLVCCMHFTVRKTQNEYVNISLKNNYETPFFVRRSIQYCN